MLPTVKIIAKKTLNKKSDSFNIIFYFFELKLNSFNCFKLIFKTDSFLHSTFTNIKINFNIYK